MYNEIQQNSNKKCREQQQQKTQYDETTKKN